jgi:uncharacterized membrane protein
MGELQASWKVEIDAPMDRVWTVAADVPNSPGWQPSLETVKTIETDADGRATLVDTEADAVVRKTKQRLRFDYQEPDGMTWEQEKGDVKSLHGSWKFTDLGDDRTEAVYDLRIDPGRMLGMLVRGPVESKVKEFLTKGAAEGLKERVESTG